MNPSWIRRHIHHIAGPDLHGKEPHRDCGECRAGPAVPTYRRPNPEGCPGGTACRLREKNSLDIVARIDGRVRAGIQRQKSLADEQVFHPVSISRILTISALLTTGSSGSGMHLQLCLRQDCDLFFRFEFILEIQKNGFFDLLEEFFKVPPIGEDAVSDCASRSTAVFIDRFKSDDHDVNSRDEYGT
nr:hypothetical protein [Methanoculleus chikugoensis]